MASGGNFYECPVCLNDMVHRSPKLLQCHHSFCLDCLQVLVKDGGIVCPTCRSVTRVTSEGAESLVSNFHLVQMYEREQGLMRQMKNINLNISCQMCMREDGVEKCQTCPARMCKGCSAKHARLPQFQGHVVHPLCTSHDKGITHICLKCVASVCPTCILVDHEDHANEVQPYDQGVNAMKGKVEKLQQRVVSEQTSIGQYESAIGKRMAVNDEIRNIIKGRYEKSVRETERLRKLLESANKAYDLNRQASLAQVKETKASYQQIKAALDGFLKGGGEILVKKFAEVNTLEMKFTDTQKKKKVEYEISPLALTDPEFRKVAQSTESKIWLSKPIPVLSLTDGSNADLQLKWPQQILALATDSILFANDDPGQAIRLDKKGNIIQKYLPNDPTSNVCGLAMHDFYVYIHDEKKIIKMPLKPSSGERQVVYTPNVYRISKLFVVNSDRFLISDCDTTDGKIYEYTPTSNMTRVCLSGLQGPSYITMALTADGPRYVVTMFSSHSVHVYDKDWKRVVSIGKGWGRYNGQLSFPKAAALTDAGTVLVADDKNSRICEFKMDGTFVRHVLTKDDGIKTPFGLAYSHPNLWITEGFSSPTAAIKCFQIAE